MSNNEDSTSTDATSHIDRADRAQIDRACYKHPDKRGGVTCQRCDQPICPFCMHQASVGFHCPDCARTGSQSIAALPPVTPAPDTNDAFWVTKILMGVNIAAFGYSIAAGSSPVSIRGSSALADGGLFARLPYGDGGEVIGVDTGEYYRLITSGLLPDGIFHLGFNLYVLWLLGQLLELAFGKLRFFAVYLVSLMGGSFGVMLMDPNRPTVGASGAIFGLLAAMIVIQRVGAGRKLWKSTLGTLLIINLALTLFVPGLSIGGHFGGLITGFYIGGIMLWFMIKDVSEWITALVTAGFVVLLGFASVWAASKWEDPVLSVFEKLL